jgi:hypothetical protein
MKLAIGELHPLTEELLENFELADQGQVLLVDYYGGKYIGEYEWRQGKYPHGFAVGDNWIGEGEIEFVAFFIEE